MPATRATTASMDGSPESSHAYNSWRARARALVSGRCTRGGGAELFEGVGRLQGRLGGLDPLVARRAAGAGERLLQGLGGGDTETQSDAVRQRDVAQAARGFAGDVLEVRGLAADHAAERDDDVVPPAHRGRLRGHGQLERPGYPHDVHARVGEVVA